MIVDWQYEPIKGALLHIDLKRIAMDKALTVGVPIVLKGGPTGVKQQGGILEQIRHKVEVECLPGDIPSHIEADVSELVFGKVLRVSDLPRSDKLKFLTDANAPVAHVISVKEEVAPTPEAVAAEAAATPAEPEDHQEGQAGGRRRGRRRACRRQARKGREARRRKEVTIVVGRTKSLAVRHQPRSGARMQPTSCPERSRRVPLQTGRMRALAPEGCPVERKLDRFVWAGKTLL